MFLGILVLITALSISAVAIYYSVAGLVAIFAAASVPIMIMGGALEIGKLVTAVWLHRYWHRAAWWLKTYLSVAVVVLMFITSMGIFGFLSRAHIEQTANATEGLAQIDRIDAEIVRQQSIIDTAKQRILEAEASVGEANNAIQEKIDIEQARIDSAYERIQPAIDEQNAIIQAARESDAKRTEPYEQQLSTLDEELKQLAIQAEQYESRIATLSVDTGSTQPIIAQIDTIEKTISLVQGQLAGGESAAIQNAQRIIGVEPDGRAGPNTRRAADAWIASQQVRINELQSQVTAERAAAQQTLDNERSRLTNLVAEIRGSQTDAVKARQLEVLATIDSVRSTESPIIKTAREEIQRIRSSADAQIAQSNSLIQSLRESITIGKDDQVEQTILDQNNKIIEANNTIDNLTQQKYQLQADYRKLEAEVGPIKYLAEFIYGEQADSILLEEAVRWVIIIIIFVFDPLAVLLLIASQATFDMRRQDKNAQSMMSEPNKENTNVNITGFSNVGNDTHTENRGKNRTDPPYTNDSNSKTGMDDRKNEISFELSRTGHENGGLEQPEIFITKENENDNRIQEIVVSSDADVGKHSTEHNPTDTIEDVQRLEQDQIQIDDDRQGIESKKKDLELQEELNLDISREEQYNIKEKTERFIRGKEAWKKDNPDETLKHYKQLYIKGVIDSLPWEDYTTVDNYKQNSEQNEKTLFSKIQSVKRDQI